MQVLEVPYAAWYDVWEAGGVRHAESEDFSDYGAEIGEGLNFLTGGAGLSVRKDFGS